MMRRTKKYLAVAVVALASVLVLRSVACAAISGTLNSLQSDLGTAVQLDGRPALGTFRGGLLQWTQDPQSAAYSPTSLWNGRAGFSSTNFVSVSLGMTMNATYGADATYQLSALAGAVVPRAAAYIAELWYNHNQELAGLKGVSSSTFQSMGHNNKESQNSGSSFISAFQIAVWKLATDQGLSFNLSSARLMANSGPDAQLAQGWLNELQAEGTAGKKANLFALSSGLQTTQIVELSPVIAPLIQSQPVPEPATIVIWGLFAAIGLAGGRCRWKRHGGPRPSTFRAELG